MVKVKVVKTAQRTSASLGRGSIGGGSAAEAAPGKVRTGRMTAGATQHQTLTTRDKILRQGLALMSEAGLGGVTLGLLADQVGMSKSGLFAHFKSKEDVQ